MSQHAPDQQGVFAQGVSAWGMVSGGGGMSAQDEGVCPIGVHPSVDQSEGGTLLT